MKNNKGITLIALVITIIVLLILAGITIAMLTGDNGLLTKSNQAKVKDLSASATEKVKLAVAAANLEMQTQLVTNSSYDPQTANYIKSGSGTTAVYENSIKKLIEDDLKPTGDWEVAPKTGCVTGEGSATTTTALTVTFKNSDYVNSVEGNQPKTYTVTLKVPDSSDHNGITVAEDNPNV